MRYRIPFVALTAAAVGLLVSCLPPLGLHGDLGLGGLTIRVADDLARTLEPPVGTAIARYDVFGAGPNGAFVYTSFTGNAVTIEKLVSGDWNADEFIVVPPGGKIIPSYDENVLGWEPGD